MSKVTLPGWDSCALSRTVFGGRGLQIRNVEGGTLAREEQFDSFYHATRRSLVHQTFALTGDLGAAQAAVREAYTAAWHHWRKASAYADPQDWVRPRAWQQVQRRHTARLRHRTKGLSDHDRTVLDAVAQLPATQRRLLVLVHLAEVPLTDSARELNLPLETAERNLREGTVTFAEAFGTEATPQAVRTHLVSLGATAGSVSLPRPSIVRRAGQKRRRSHTAIAAAAATFLSVAAGAFTYQPTGAEPADSSAASGPAHDGTAGEPADAPAAPASSPDPSEALPTAEELLDAGQIAHLGGAPRWRVVETHDNTDGDGINSICQQSRFADPDGLSAVVRTFQAAGERRRNAVQTLEISESEDEATRTYRTMLDWYAACETEQVQLLRSYRVDGVGERGHVLLLRSWSRPVDTYTVGLAQVGQVVTSIVGRAPGAEVVKAGRATRALQSAATQVCEKTGAGTCAAKASYASAAPPMPGSEKGMLSIVDLPDVGVGEPWAGTRARGGRRNPASTTCDRANFARAGATRTRTRTFLIPGARLPTRFGLTETYGVFGGPRAARRFLSEVRSKVARCEDRDLATDLVGARSTERDGFEIVTWDLETEISDNETVVFRTGFVRAGKRVAQVTLAPAGRADLGARDLQDLLLRAGERLLEV